ncbi:sigma-54-dependent Fis family transcriptional regulator [Pacificimonas flava]|uniref:DNA-binding transcriptional regulator NtrC n=2 Tax=Pacificimonas TaxID=1960290 RepID=A0A219B5J3_9SPHN|nr:MULTISPECIES: sigma-54 dependent transcriptional regulator [Pacificimonas]MBZ6377211.1 sigma-54-dependent Fis family transcriptional regulator [Pacificimonas aurantium]OWV33069.1 sigma-54-dependent Fis family transcriptional regulator [Pacificimonas flava]
MSGHVLVVDDEPGQRRLVRIISEKAGYTVSEAESGLDALDMVQGGGPAVDAVILDHSMPDMSGLEMLAEVRRSHGDLPVIMLTAHSSVKIAVEAMQAGATDFLIKPAKPDKIVGALQAVLEGGKAAGELQPLSEKLPLDVAFDNIVGSAPAFQSALSVASKAAKRNVPVLVEGESGTGKEVIAGAIHAASPRSGQPLVIVNCGAIPANLVESVLFGHEKGAFTGATSKHVGRFEEADGGTLFLDEIGELPLDAQVKLLRALQTGQIEPVGARGHKTVDVRIVAATNRDLREEVAAGRFREDLYYRLGVVPITIPPLRERRADIAPLARHFAERLHEEGNIPASQLDQEALNVLTSYDWPGNVRQLQNAVFRAGVLCEGDTLGRKDFPEIARLADEGLLNSPLADTGAVQTPDQAGDRPGHAAIGPDGHVRSLAALEKEHIRLALIHYRGRMSEVARRLGIGRSTLYRKLGEYALDESELS